MRLLCIISAALLATATLLADDRFPTSNWKDAPDPLASPEASVGGSISTFAGQYPQSFNYYLANNSFCAEHTKLSRSSAIVDKKVGSIE